MLRSVAVTRIQDGLGFRTDMADKIILRLQEEQRDLEKGKTLPSFLKVFAGFTYLVGEAQISLPTGFLRITDAQIALIDDDGVTWRHLPWRNLENVGFFLDNYGQPNVASLDLVGNRIAFDQTAVVDTIVYLEYYKAADLLTSDIENVWLENAPELLIGGAGRRIAADMRNKTAFELFDAMWKQSRASWFNEAVLEDVDEAGPLVLGANS